VLCLTCNNMTNNDTMANDLANCIPSFPGQAHRVSCFAHIVNLVAKSLLRQFNTPKKANGNSGNDEDD
ncbi:hypothetical protein ARMGADRAFT_891383, partial [Armillaria gallica]